MAEATILRPFEQANLRKHKDPTSAIRARQTEEIVLSVCGYIGAGVSGVAKTLEEIFTQHNYEVNIIKISDIIRELKKIPKPNSKTYDDVERMQDAGNELRVEYDNSYLAQCAIEQMSLIRHEGKSKEEIFTPETRRHITIIDSLKHPEEFELLSLIYGEMFYLVGVICPDDKRRDRLKDVGFLLPDIEKCIDRDRKQSTTGGQNTAETLYRSDFFVDNSNDTERAHKSQLERFVEIVLGKRSHSPTNDEYAMFCAYASSLRSGCLSRQVGAAILKEGVLVATGRNDVPKNCGGLYCEDDELKDHRCLKMNPPECKSDNKKEKLISEISKSIHGISEQFSDIEMAEKIYDAISKNSMIKGLVEYSRAVHAEMDAITSVARVGGISLSGAILYCTTFPCHHCARHILSSGIKRVVYIEPYDKSLAYDLHKDSIAVDVSDTSKINKLHMVHFKGISPKRYAHLFHYATRKNKQGQRLEYQQMVSKPYLQKLIDTFTDYELKVVDLKKEKEHSVRGGKSNE